MAKGDNNIGLLKEKGGLIFGLSVNNKPTHGMCNRVVDRTSAVL